MHEFGFLYLTKRYSFRNFSNQRLQMDSTLTKPIPKVLVSYLGIRGIAVLENLELMFSSPADFNDPFEFLPKLDLPKESCGNERDARAAKAQRLYGFNSFVFCMTDKEHNVRMWDHYGDGHRGLMISLDFGGLLSGQVEKGFVLPVDYNSATRFEPLNESVSQVERRKRFEAIITHKGEDWEPESEYRWLLPAQNCHWRDKEKEPGQTGELRVVDGKMKAFLPIESASILKVTLGYRSSPALLNTVLQLRSRQNARWTVAKVKLSVETFEFEEDYF